jgi:hypothetical protein
MRKYFVLAGVVPAIIVFFWGLAAFGNNTAPRYFQIIVILTGVWLVVSLIIAWLVGIERDTSIENEVYDDNRSSEEAEEQWFIERHHSAEEHKQRDFSESGNYPSTSQSSSSPKYTESYSPRTEPSTGEKAAGSRRESPIHYPSTNRPVNQPNYPPNYNPYPGPTPRPSPPMPPGYRPPGPPG